MSKLKSRMSKNFSKSIQNRIQNGSQIDVWRSKFEVWRGSGRLLGASWSQDVSQTLPRRSPDAFLGALGCQVGANLEAKRPLGALLEAFWTHF